MRVESGYGSRPDERDPRDRFAFATYWRLRQGALGIETNGETMTRDEIVFAEHMLALGHELEWLPRDMRTRRPTNDFRWLSNDGIVCELKTTTASYKSIKRLVSGAVRRAGAQDVVKENFIVNIRGSELTEKLTSQLARYNERNSAHPITRLWVMSRGRLAEIVLR
ncbi:hypothetical protein [Nocardioides sp.]|uniref:hypothetical protein n=1 Tax=Nocardioides sp. TaxID=35761 RepID=UPI0039E2BF0E